MSATQALLTTAADNKRRSWMVGISMLGAIADHVINTHPKKMRHQPANPSILGVLAQQANENLPNNKVQIPDEMVNLINYGLTAWLASAGGKKRAKNQPFLPIAMGVKSIADATVAIDMASKDWQKHKKVGTDFQIAAFAALVAAVVAVPEMIKGIQYLMRSK